MRAIFVGGVMLALGTALTLGACKDSSGGGAAPAGDADPTTLKGKPAADFSLPTLGNTNVSLAGEKGKVVLIDTWATWCPPCRASLPHIQKISSDSKRAAQGLVVWAINDGETTADVSKFLADNKYTFTVLMDPQATVLSKYHVSGIPTTFIVGRDGTIQDVFVGYDDHSAEAIDAAIDKALAEPAPH